MKDQTRIHCAKCQRTVAILDHGKRMRTTNVGTLQLDQERGKVTFRCKCGANWITTLERMRSAIAQHPHRISVGADF